MTTLFGMIENAPAGALCVRIGNDSLTYGAFRRRVNRMAAGLTALGLRQGDCVAIWLPNCVDWLVMAVACARNGMSVLSMNVRLGPLEIGDFIERANAKALMFSPNHGDKDYGAILAGVDRTKLSGLITAITPEGKPLNYLACDTVGMQQLLNTELCPDDTGTGTGQDPCIIFASSGTTSRPKLIRHSQQGATSHGHDVAKAFGLDEENAVVYSGIPFCGAFGFTAALGALAANRPIISDETFDAAAAVETIDRQSVTHMFGTNEMLHRMLNVAGDAWRPKTLQSFAHANFTPGLDSLPLRAETQGVHIRGCFGMSETFALFAVQRSDSPLDRRAETGGIPICNTAKVRVRDLNGDALLGVGVEGALEFYSPNLMMGYVGDEQATRAAITDDGYLRSGDIGYLTKDGGFTHLSRVGDVMRIGGYLVNPLEIEEVVMNFPDVSACQVVEYSAPQGPRPIAFVIGTHEYVHDEPALIAYCKARLATFKVPVRFLQISAFPVTTGPNGTKVRKAELREQAVRLVAG